MKTKRRLLIAGVVLGSLLTLSPVFGMLGTVFGMSRAFNALGSPGIGDPQALSHSIGMTLLSTMAGLLLCPVGIAIFVLSLVFLLRLRSSTPPSLPAQQHHEPGNIS